MNEEFEKETEDIDEINNIIDENNIETDDEYERIIEDKRFKKYLDALSLEDRDIDIEYTEEEIGYIVLDNIKFMNKISIEIYDEMLTTSNKEMKPLDAQLIIGEICFRRKVRMLGNQTQNFVNSIHKNNEALYDQVIIKMAKKMDEKKEKNDALSLLIHEHLKLFYSYSRQFYNSQPDEFKHSTTIDDIIMEIIGRFVEIVKYVYNVDKGTAINTYFLFEIKKLFAKIRGQHRTIKIDDNKINAEDQLKRVENKLRNAGATEVDSVMIADFMNLRNYCTKSGKNYKEVTAIQIAKTRDFMNMNNESSLDEMEETRDILDAEEYSTADIYKNPASIAIDKEKRNFIINTIEKSMSKLEVLCYKLYLRLTEEEMEISRMRDIITRDISLSAENKEKAREALKNKEYNIFHGNSIPKEIAIRLGVKIADVNGWISDANRILRDSKDVRSYFGKDRVRVEYSMFEGGGLLEQLIGGIEIETW